MAKLPNIFISESKNLIASFLFKGYLPKEILSKCECHLEEVYSVLREAKYQDFVRGEVNNLLHGVGAQTAVNTLIEIAKDKNAPKQSRVSASDKLLSYTGYRMNEAGMLEKSPSTMTQSELLTRLDTLQREREARAKPITIDGEVVEAETIDIDKLLE